MLSGPLLYLLFHRHEAEWEIGNKNFLLVGFTILLQTRATAIPHCHTENALSSPPNATQ
jgi:hypothetical protein